jgi:hypothetical protein
MELKRELVKTIKQHITKPPERPKTHLLIQKLQKTYDNYKPLSKIDD